MESLSRRVREGDGEAREILILRNVNLVKSIAKKYKGRGLDLVDLVSEGSLGLIRAVEQYSPDKGIKFSTYASYWIKQSITMAIMRYSKTIRHPVWVYKSASKWAKSGEELNARQADILKKLKESQIDETFDAPQPEEIKRTNPEITEKIRVCIDGLGDREQFIIRHRYGLDGMPTLSYKNICQELGLSKMVVKLKERRSIETLRTAIMEI